jgi:CPSF A subunit region
VLLHCWGAQQHSTCGPRGCELRPAHLLGLRALSEWHSSAAVCAPPPPFTPFRQIGRLPNFITSLATAGDRIFIGDLQESFHYAKYKKAENVLYVYADDVAPRYLTASLPLDYDTMAGADKFGNIFMTRLPAAISSQVPGWID